MKNGNYNLDRARSLVFRNQAKAIVLPVLVLSIIAWWKQGLLTAAIGGAALYIFLLLALMASNYMEWRKHTRR